MIFSITLENNKIIVQQCSIIIFISTLSVFLLFEYLPGKVPLCTLLNPFDPSPLPSRAHLWLGYIFSLSSYSTILDARFQGKRNLLSIGKVALSQLINFRKYR
jgi:hypothetical protein